MPSFTCSCPPNTPTTEQPSPLFPRQHRCHNETPAADGLLAFEGPAGSEEATRKALLWLEQRLYSMPIVRGFDVSDDSNVEGDHVEKPHELPAMHARNDLISRIKAEQVTRTRSRSPDRHATISPPEHVQQPFSDPLPEREHYRRPSQYLSTTPPLSRPQHTVVSPSFQHRSSISQYYPKPPTSPLVHATTSAYGSEGSDPIDIGSSADTFELGSPRLPYHSSHRPSHSYRPHSLVGSLGFSYSASPGNGLPMARSGRRTSATALNHHHELFGSFVGSYEESILSGRMSTLPSKPLNFIAQIGVLGLGKCKSSLRCPPHVTIPFPAYFYTVPECEGPSPYVGQVDIEAALTDKKKFPGGYRIPPRGQLQIVIKNANNTAVKLFLVPYDVTDMPPGTRTFLRQKHYSKTNPIDDALASSSNNASLKPDQDKETLRYALHLHICSPSKDKFYLYKNIRVVFANRVPDGKEKLRVEVQYSQPKYTKWVQGDYGKRVGLMKELQERNRPVLHVDTKGANCESNSPADMGWSNYSPTRVVPSPTSATTGRSTPESMLAVKLKGLDVGSGVDEQSR
ncbi:hypothetical protein SAICODRAFT_23500 [Saitoella complicata NRRL Y-17804]|nr:uncharacterized protein SAICODRAFT_23500 [Saitoella complicata NRRL Y-17804]ODQ55464.1 hypothetical protein SAICODRAFT_23500 [Saitoella complicata NRRL Y-17804]